MDAHQLGKKILQTLLVIPIIAVVIFYVSNVLKRTTGNQSPKQINVPSDALWEAIASRYKEEECDFSDLPALKATIGGLEPVKQYTNGTKTFIVPCRLHAYQSSALVVLSDGTTYSPLLMTVLDQNGEKRYVYANSEVEYRADEDIFTSFTKGRGLADCGTVAEYKLTDRALVLKKFDADWECDGKLELRTIFDFKSP